MTFKTTFIENKTFSQFLAKAYTHLFFGLLLTSIVAYFGMYLLAPILYSGAIGIILLFIVQFGLMFYFLRNLNQMSKNTATLCFYFYCLITGITLSYIPLLYDGGTLAIAILMTAIVFGAMAVIGYTTNKDLSKYGPLFSAGLIAIIVMSIINVVFIKSSGLDLMVDYAVILIFLGLIAYDMQMLRNFYSMVSYDEAMFHKMAIYGAFQLYLDFINLFLRVLRILANRNNKD